MAVNRIRNKDIHIMVTKYEYALIKERLKMSGKKSLREYLVNMAINGYLINVDFKEMKNLAYEVNKVGTNINQIAHKANSTNSINQTDIDEIKDKLDIIWKLIRAEFYGLNKK